MLLWRSLHRPIELLEGCSAETLASWLKKYPKLRIIGRDRSTEYERAIEDGAPQAVEVLDRWHLLKNLRQSTEHVLESNSATLSAITPPTKDEEKDPLVEHAPVPRSSKERAASAAYRNKMLARYKKVKKLHAQGMKMLAICRATGMSRGAVRRYVHADSFPERRRHQRPKTEGALSRRARGSKKRDLRVAGHLNFYYLTLYKAKGFRRGCSSEAFSGQESEDPRRSRP